MTKPTRAQAKTEIVIDLNQPLSNLLSASSNDNNETRILQEDAAQRIEILLNNFHIQAKEITKNTHDDFNPIRCNNTIFIDGERGAGKTTFLHTILKKYNIAKDLNVCPLPLIDPTLVETHQHVLIEIVTKFVRQLDKKLKCCQDERKYQQFREHLDVMAEGLKLLNQKEKTNKEPADASWFLEKALNKATNGQDLERHFHQLLDSIADMLDIDLFLIAIDDVDTQTEKADEVLEVLRCYLTHPKLVILISGDLKLYSHIVRNNKRKELNEQQSQSDEKVEALIGHLEQQYLAKVLPVEQRIQLKKLDELSGKYEIEIKHINLIYEGSEKSIEIKKIVADIFSQALNFRQDHVSSHLDFLLSQPVRSVLQLIKTMLDAIDVKEDEKRKFKASTLKNAIYQSFIGDLVNEDLKLENLMQKEPHINAISYELFKIIYRNRDLETGFYSRPDSSYDQSGYNAAKIYLSASIASLFESSSNLKNISKVIKIMLSTGIVSNVYQTYVANNLEEKYSEKDYLDYVGLSRNEGDMHSLASHISPIILHHKNNDEKAIHSGVIRTTRYMGSNTKSFEEFLSKHIDIKRVKTLSALEKTEPSESEDYKNIFSIKAVLFSAHSAATSTEGRDYISIYTLLSSIAELLENTDKNIQKLITLKNYIYPAFLNGKIKGEEDNVDDDFSENVQENTPLGSFIESINHWQECNSSNDVSHGFSSLLIGKVTSRIIYSLNQVSENARKKMTYSVGEKRDIVLGVAFSRFIWAIINSMLIEEFRYSININDVELKKISQAKNTSTSPTELIKNIKAINSEDLDWKNNLPLTYALITCPLLWPFLGKYINGRGEEQSDLFDIISEVIEPDKDQSSSSTDAPSFRSIAENSEPSKLIVSALAIVGCFRS
ncbi:P-loop NTPase fold protein [Halomonas sp. SpR1]|uniref:P-loop NTPase fold protein n=1 Tax=Halomonas sp. SpR1 TaxID=3050462 RepID=UPI0027E5AAC5|nr:P-loop NTPase fold protein [Halomonas sp. SpR1]MDQ7734254.1 P-loop NTPase fold protein [Halomonas sp. SpR1]